MRTLKLLLAMQTLGNCTGHLKLPTDYGPPLEVYRRGMKALLDFERRGTQGYLDLAYLLALQLESVYGRHASTYGFRGRRQDDVEAAVAEFRKPL